MASRFPPPLCTGSSCLSLGPIPAAPGFVRLDVSVRAGDYSSEVSLNCRIVDANADGFTHAIYMRFHKKEDLRNFYGNSGYLGVLDEYVMPQCYDSISVDYESEVEDDILPIFRRGEEFNYGVEFVLLFSVVEHALDDAVDDAVAALQALIDKFSWLIVQATHGSNFSPRAGEYTHGAVIRFPSAEALESFRGCSDYKEVSPSRPLPPSISTAEESFTGGKLQPITRKALAVHFAVDPVGTDVM
ncbi:unnamed protein product [Spirodela intermedia]|uniref:Stress-response A/B barrel domain-containing protein n=1 Tax=Spirodela intermedia TaxID=51605 RepID=A0A7I8KMP9_SPIIN|nr:unnamed protein product [Spirodela intermedia]